MPDTLDGLLSEVKHLAEGGDSLTALSRAETIIADYPKDPRSWLLRGYLNQRAGDLSTAVDDLTKAVALAPDSICALYSRGRCFFQTNNNEDAVADFSRAIELCDLQSDSYFLNALYFERAESYLRLGRKADALADTLKIPDGTQWWTFELRSKEDLVRGSAE